MTASTTSNTKEAYMTFRVEKDLREAFHAAAAQRERRPGAQVLREYMRDYVEGRSVPQVDEAEQQRRKEAVRQAHASAELEGLKLSPATLERGRRFVNGDIEFAEYMKQAGDEARGR